MRRVPALGQRMLHHAETKARVDDDLSLLLAQVDVVARSVAATDIAADEPEVLVVVLLRRCRVEPRGDVETDGAIRQRRYSSIDHDLGIRPMVVCPSGT